MWDTTPADENVSFPCRYGSRDGVQDAMVWRSCNDRGIWIDPVLDDCLTFVTSSLENITKVCHQSITLTLMILGSVH